MPSRRSLSMPIVAVLGTFALVGPVLGAPSAAGTADMTPPTIVVSAAPTFVVGSTIGPSTASPPEVDNGPYTYTGGIAQRLSWTGGDSGSGVCAFAAYSTYMVDIPQQLTVVGPTVHTTVSYGQDYDGAFSAHLDGYIDHWTVLARDCAGNVGWSVAHLATSLAVVQEDGGHPDYWSPPQLSDDTAVTYAGTWTREFNDAYSGGAAQVAHAAGATVSVRTSFVGGDPIAIVVDRGPAQGAADVYVDGHHAGHVNAHTASVSYRYVAWQRVMTAGAHTVTLVSRSAAPFTFDAVLLQRDLVNDPPWPGPDYICPDPSDYSACFAN